MKTKIILFLTCLVALNYTYVYAEEGHGDVHCIELEVVNEVSTGDNFEPKAETCLYDPTVSTENECEGSEYVTKYDYVSYEGKYKCRVKSPVQEQLDKNAIVDNEGNKENWTEKFKKLNDIINAIMQ